MNSTVTATLAGQIVVEGFVRLRMPAWARRLITRGLAIVPVVFITALYGDRGTAHLLVFSQVILSMQLPFAAIPLTQFVCDRGLMGPFFIGRWTKVLTWAVTSLIVILNGKLLIDFIAG